MPLYYLGEFTKPVSKNSIHHIRNAQETESLKIGDVVECWDHVFEWDHDCVKASTLEKWRSQGDELCDDALTEMFPAGSVQSVGTDLLSVLESTVALYPDGKAAKFLNAAKEPLPIDIACSIEDMDRAIDFFLGHSVGIMQALMHFSLAGGFASPRITKVLQQVSYLVPPSSKSQHLNGVKDGATTSPLLHISETSNKRTFSRLLETMQFILDAMNCVVPSSSQPAKQPSCHHLLPGGEGWKSTIRVRLLHGIARRRIIESGTRKGYDSTIDGIPINQEDLAATLGTFSIAPLWCLTRLPHLWKPSLTEQTAYINTWRHIGFYLGISPAILRSHFSTPKQSTKLLASTILHLIEFPSTEEGRQMMAAAPTIPILLAISDRPPFPKSFSRNCAITRFLLGDALCTRLSVPETSYKDYLWLRFMFYKERLPEFFGQIYPRKGWQIQRKELVGIAMARVVRWQLGMRRTKFRPRDPDTGEVKYESDAAKKDEEITLDTDGAKRLVSQWRRLLIEMVFVSASTILIAGVGAATLWKCNTS